MSATMNMQILIGNIVTFITKARQDGAIRPTESGSGTLVFKGYPTQQKPIALTAMPSIIIDDGGEKFTIENYTTQRRIYTVVVELMIYSSKIETALDTILGFENEVRKIFELKANKQLDGMNFGAQITPIIYEDEQSRLYRGRRIMVEYTDLEDIYEQF